MTVSILNRRKGRCSQVAVRSRFDEPRVLSQKNQQDSAATAGVLRQASPAGLSDARRMEGVIVELWRLTTTRQMMVLLVRHSK